MKKLTNTPGACAIIAIRYAARTSDAAALRACINQGQFDEQWQKAAEELGLKLTKVRSRKILLKNFLKKFPEGMFIVGTHDHLFVVDNGKVVDPAYDVPGLSRTLTGAWLVE